MLTSLTYSEWLRIMEAEDGEFIGWTNEKKVTYYAKQLDRCSYLRKERDQIEQPHETPQTD